MKFFLIFLIFIFYACHNEVKIDTNVNIKDTVIIKTDTVLIDTMKIIIKDTLLQNDNYPYLNIPHVDSALYYATLGIKEIGKNEGFNNQYFEDKIYYQGWRPSYSWCAYAVKTFLIMGDVIYPVNKGGYATDFIKKDAISANDVRMGKIKINPGLLTVFRHGNEKRGHVGITYEWDNTSGIVIEGNTSPDSKGSQSDGEGLYIKHRTIQVRNYFRIVNFQPVKYK